MGPIQQYTQGMVVINLEFKAVGANQQDKRMCRHLCRPVVITQNGCRIGINQSELAVFVRRRTVRGVDRTERVVVRNIVDADRAKIEMAPVGVQNRMRLFGVK